MIYAIYRADGGMAGKRYVKKDGDRFKFVIKDAIYPSYDFEIGFCDGNDLQIKTKENCNSGKWVEWPQKMDKDFFVILTTQNSGITPMTDDKGELATYETFAEADEAAKNSALGEAFGYEVFERGCGV